MNKYDIEQSERKLQGMVDEYFRKKNLPIYDSVYEMASSALKSSNYDVDAAWKMCKSQFDQMTDPSIQRNINKIRELIDNYYIRKGQYTPDLAFMLSAQLMTTYNFDADKTWEFLKPMLSGIPGEPHNRSYR